MKSLTLVVMVILAAGSIGGVAHAVRCADGMRIFADVGNDHPMCKEIESLYRDGLTSGCRVKEDGTRYYCPDAVVTRAQAAMLAEHRDPFVQLDRNGRINIGDHVAHAERFGAGHYWVRFTRDVSLCSREAWTQDLVGPSISVRSRALNGTVDIIEVETSRNGVPTDMWINVRMHCK